MTADPSTPEGRAELRKLLGDGHPADGHALVPVSRITALLDALTEAQDTIRGYESAVEGLTATIGEQRAENARLLDMLNRANAAEAEASVRLESVRAYAQTLHALADIARDAGGTYLAHAYDNTATALERKIGELA